MVGLSPHKEITTTMTTTATEDTGIDVMPSSLTDLEPIVREFIDKLKQLKNEQATLKLDEKELMEEYKAKLDLKTLKAAMKVVEVRDKVDRKDTFDSLVEVLERTSMLT